MGHDGHESREQQAFTSPYPVKPIVSKAKVLRGSGLLFGDLGTTRRLRCFGDGWVPSFIRTFGTFAPARGGAPPAPQIIET